MEQSVDDSGAAAFLNAPVALRWLSHVNAWSARISGGAAAALLTVMTVVIALAVYFRYVLNDSLLWAEELTRYSAVWLVFIGTGVAHRWGQHVRIGLLLEKFPRRAGYAGEFVVELIVLAIFGIIAWFGWEITEANFERYQTSPAMGIPIAWVYLAIPVGLGLAALQSLERLLWASYQLVAGKEIPPRPFGDEPEDKNLPREIGA